MTFSDDDGRLKIAGRKDKTAVTFSDDDSKVIAKMRSRLQIERHRTTDQDVYTDLRLYISVIEKMVEALGLPLANT